ncbi:MAG: hypothetical protein ACE5DR_00055 [Thermodesulfobacteriota bacterium]
MNIYGNNLISGRNARLLNLMLISLGLFFIGWTISIWIAPSTVPSSGLRHKKEVSERYERQRLLRMSAYNNIVKNDLFMSTRRQYVPPPKHAPVKRAVRSAAPLKTPDIRLLGTVILDNGRAAVMSLQGMESETRSYKVGDTLGGFKINKITDNSVSLQRGAETLTVFMNEKAGEKVGKRGAVPSFRGGTAGSTGTDRKPRPLSPRWLTR